MIEDDPFIDLCDSIRGEHWRDDSLCKEYPDLAWFPERGEPVRPQLEVCGRCLVRIECLDHALRVNEVHGIWGGHSQSSLRNLKRLRAMRARTGQTPLGAADLEALASPHPSTTEQDDDAAA